jgi:glutaredoxin 2
MKKSDLIRVAQFLSKGNNPKFKNDSNYQAEKEFLIQCLLKSGRKHILKQQLKPHLEAIHSELTEVGSKVYFLRMANRIFEQEIKEFISQK